MLPGVDAVTKIEQLYEGRKGPVPYVVFMEVFNDLLEDPRELHPRTPSQELFRTFRAACMAVTLGVLDPEGRDQQRLKELREIVIPVWREKLPKEQFGEIDAMLNVPKRRRAERRARQGLELPATPKATGKSGELLLKLGLIEAGPKDDTAVVEPTEEQEEEPLEQPRSFDSVTELCRAVSEGALRVRYWRREDNREFARYLYEGLEVVVRLAAADEHYYVVLTAAVGRPSGADAVQFMDETAARMGYVRMGEFAYLRRDGKLLQTLRVGKDRLSIACASEDQGSQRVIARRIQKLHWDLGELVDTLRR